MLGTPAIFIRVSQYKTWINSVIRTSQPGYITFKSNGTDSDLSVSCKAPPRLTTTPSPTTTTVDAVVCGQASLNSRVSEGVCPQSDSGPGWPVYSSTGFTFVEGLWCL